MGTVDDQHDELGSPLYWQPCLIEQIERLAGGILREGEVKVVFG
jgi:hypothetical protein